MGLVNQLAGLSQEKAHSALLSKLFVKHLRSHLVSPTPTHTGAAVNHSLSQLLHCSAMVRVSLGLNFFQVIHGFLRQCRCYEGFAGSC